jgi:hypothetical protein
MFDTLFDPPFWLPVGLLTVAGYLFWSGNRSQDTTLRNVGVGGLLLAVGLMVVAYFVDTPTESAVKKTQSFVSAIDQRDWATFDSLLDPKTNVMIYRGKEQISTGAKKTVDMIGLKKVNLLGTEARRAQSLITVDINCLSEQEINPYPTPTAWRFSWQFDGSAWYLARIEYLPRENLPPDAVTNRLARP